MPEEVKTPRLSLEHVVFIALGIILVVFVIIQGIGVWQGEDHIVAFTIGPVTVRWYGILLMSGALAGALVGEAEARRRGLNPDHVWNILLWGLILGVIMSRLWFILGDWSYFSGDILRMIGFENGQFVGLRGLTIHGALFGAVLAAGLYAWRHKLNILTWLDVGAPGFVMGQAVGRWGNFFNQEAYGLPTTLPWGLRIAPIYRVPAYPVQSYPFETTRFHPAFLYESLFDLALCIFLLFLARRLGEKLIAGEIFWLYGMLYAVARFGIEPLRVDSMYLGSFRAAQVVSVGLFLVCAGALVARRWIWKPRVPLASPERAELPAEERAEPPAEPQA